MNRGNFFSELKRRNVIRMAGLYLVGAWLLTQVASTLLPAFDVPSHDSRARLYPGGDFSWVFELTPEGLKREEDVAPGQSITPQTGRRMDRMIIVVLVLALGYFHFDGHFEIGGMQPISPTGGASCGEWRWGLVHTHERLKEIVSKYAPAK
jgi:hypothetical protein